MNYCKDLGSKQKAKPRCHELKVRLEGSDVLAIRRGEATPPTSFRTRDEAKET